MMTPDLMMPAALMLVRGDHRALSSDVLAAALLSVDPYLLTDLVNNRKHEIDSESEIRAKFLEVLNSDSDCGAIPVPARRYSLTSPPPSPFDGEEALKEFHARLQGELLERGTGDNLAQSYLSLLLDNQASFCRMARAHFADLTVTEAHVLRKYLISILPAWMLGASADAPERLSHEEQRHWVKSFRNIEILEAYLNFLLTTEVGYWRSMSDMHSYYAFRIGD